MDFYYPGKGKGGDLPPRHIKQKRSVPGCFLLTRMLQERETDSKLSACSSESAELRMD